MQSNVRPNSVRQCLKQKNLMHGNQTLSGFLSGRYNRTFDIQLDQRCKYGNILKIG